MRLGLPLLEARHEAVVLARGQDGFPEAFDGVTVRIQPCHLRVGQRADEGLAAPQPAGGGASPWSLTQVAIEFCDICGSVGKNREAACRRYAASSELSPPPLA